jgi:hypothetical protein
MQRVVGVSEGHSLVGELNDDRAFILERYLTKVNATRSLG